MPQVKTLGIIGAGKLGITLAQLALKAGYKVLIAGSGEPSKIALSVEVLAPGAIAMSSSTVAKQSDVVILAIPLGKYDQLPKDDLAAKIVIDAMNYWWEVDGERPDLTDPSNPSSALVQQFLDKSIVVKALNHMGYHDLHDEAAPRGAHGRKAIAVAGDNESALDMVSRIIDDLGFDPVRAGQLADSTKLQPGSPIFGANVEKDELLQMINDADVQPRTHTNV